MRLHISIRLPSLTNLHGMDWRKLTRLKNQQKAATKLCLLKATNNEGQIKPAPPVTVTLTRVGPRRLDDDNLAAAFKFMRDTIAAFLGLDDGSPLYIWRYAQRVGKYGVDVEITGITQ